MYKEIKQQPKQGAIPARTPRVSAAAVNTALQPITSNTATVTQAQATINENVQQLAQQLANQMVAEMQQSQTIARNGRTYTKFDLTQHLQQS